MKTVVVDANVVIRFLLNDHQKFSSSAKALFSQAQKKLLKIYLDEVILAEIIWTLSSFYKIKRADLSNSLEKLLSQDWIINPKKELMLKSLYLYRSSNLDYLDCWIYVISNDLKLSLKTFDSKLKKLGT